MMPTIDDYAVIGDGRSAALISSHASIDWLCWPRFDGDLGFAALLGPDNGGYWSISPSGSFEATRSYLRESAVLCTRFVAETGGIMVTDMMPWRSDTSQLVRRVRCEEGRVVINVVIAVRGDTGRAIPDLSGADGLWQIRAAEHILCLESGLVLQRDDESGGLTATVEMRKDDVIDFVLSVHNDAGPVQELLSKVDDLLASTEEFWRVWCRQLSYRGDDEQVILRSLITLKLLTDREQGGVVAAVTTSLPEALEGGQLNWDYRYTWLRDASMTMRTFLDCGFREEAIAWQEWLTRQIDGHPEQLQIMYGVDGRDSLPERELTGLEGYQAAQPVRIGNDAYRQTQQDVFGEILNALYRARCHHATPAKDPWLTECELIAYLEGHWREPGHGFWEKRGAPRIYTLSRVMSWVALDSACRSAQQADLGAPTDRWRELADVVRADVLDNGFNKDLGYFTTAYNGEELDAGLLLMPLYGFLEASDPRMEATIAAIETQLGEGGLLRRYHSSAESAREGTFVACGCWLVQVMVLQGRPKEARALLGRLLALANDVGLLAEEFDVRAQRLCGNFPQAISHVGIINALIACDGSAGDGAGIGP